MNAYIAIKFYEDHQNKNIIKNLKRALLESGHEGICIASDIENFGKENFTPKKLMATTFGLIDKCDFLLLEATTKGIGIGIEAGYSYAKGKPVVVVARKNTKISTTLKGIAHRILYYEDLSELVKPLGEI